MKVYDYRELERVLEMHPCRLLGNRAQTFDNAKPIGKSNPSSITFCKRDLADAEAAVAQTAASVVVCGDEVPFDEKVLAEKLLVVVEEPRAVFAMITAALFEKHPAWQVHPSAVIEHSAQIHDEVYIGPLTYVGDSVRIGKNSIIYGHCHIYPDVTINEGVIIHAGVVIGSDGFGYAQNEQGVWNKFPHLGSVVIEDNVEIGANSCIDRGTLGPTWIRKGVKLDNLVYVGHNAEIGENTAISGNTTVGGSMIGKRVWIAPGCTIKEKLVLGDDSFIGIGSVVVEDVEPGSFVLGVPARKVRTNKPG